MRFLAAFFVFSMGLAVAGCRSIAPAAVAARNSDGAISFVYAPPPTAPALSSISVRGTFNDWAEHALPMEQQPDGSWRATAELEPGAWEYKFFINRAWPADMCRDTTWGDPRHEFWIDPAAERCVADGHSGRNAVITIASGSGDGSNFVHDPSAARYVSVAGERLSVRFMVDRDQVRSARVVAGTTSVPMHRQLHYRSREIWRATIPEGTATYEIVIDTGGAPLRLGPFTVPGTPFRDVPWVGSAVGYQIFPERFRNGDRSNDSLALATNAHRHTHPRHWSAPTPPVLMSEWGGAVMDFHCCHQYFGGDLQGIIDGLDHLEVLGVTLIYLNPVFVAGSAHGYDTYDHLRVSPAFGGEVALRALLDAARQRGMRAMWDFVPNHVGVGHWAFQHAVRSGEASPYWNWFRFRVPAAQVEVGNAEHYDAWWGFGSLPELDTHNPAVLEYLMTVARHWSEFGFDGVRVDVPGDIRNRSQFFPALRRTLKTLDPDAYLVGEVWSRSPGWLVGSEFDALMNYAIGRDVIQRFAAGDMTGDAAAEAMAQLYAEYPEASAAMQFNLIASHDTPRLLTSMGGGELGDTAAPAALARQRLAAAMLYSLPGMPVTFQGDECAFLGGGPPREENRYPMQWQACDRAMVAHYAALAGARRELNALRSPVIRSIGGEGPLLWFARGEPGEGEVLAVFNAGAEPRSLVLPAGEWWDPADEERVASSAAIAGLGWRHLQRR
ncbi:MAG TPA: alpha-amylase family glycosyl hydrolase [Gemmatimonadaceae bacterium]|nr:alpha-amylase family glycosyl hydrolase [Gemmatimonadaceae bacterium]